MNTPSITKIIGRAIESLPGAVDSFTHTLESAFTGNQSNSPWNWTEGTKHNPGTAAVARDYLNATGIPCLVIGYAASLLTILLSPLVVATTVAEGVRAMRNGQPDGKVQELA